MTKSAMIKEMIMRLLADGSPHSVSEMKDYLFEKEMEDYSEGQFAGSVNNTRLKNPLYGRAIPLVRSYGISYPLKNTASYVHMT